MTNELSLSDEARAFFARHADREVGPIEVFPAPQLRPDPPSSLVVFGRSANGDLWAVDTASRPERVVVVSASADSLDDEGAVVSVCTSVSELAALAISGQLPADHFVAAERGQAHAVELDPAEERVIRDVLSVLSGRRDGLPKGSTRRVEAILGSLPANAARVVRLRVGLGESDPYTPRQVARALGIDRDAVTELESQAVEALRKRCAPPQVPPWRPSGLKPATREG